MQVNVNEKSRTFVRLFDRARHALASACRMMPGVSSTNLSSWFDRPACSWQSKAREGEKKATPARSFSTERDM
ncbi:hypothetical protein, partial [Herminiimonas sp.]|uniref:hypothetical protein n=1 Tax=Herminiimonas sp. TaxID=1926289 RepID=UPI0027263809